MCVNQLIVIVTDKPGPDPTKSPVEILEIIKLAYPPALGTSDIANEIGISQQAAQKQLNQLKNKNFVDTRKVGPARIWWLTDKGKQKIRDHQSQGSNQ